MAADDCARWFRTRGRKVRAGLVARLSLHQFRYDLRAFFRNRQSRFFTLVLPVLFLVIFASLFHASTVKVAGGSINTSVYYVPGISTLGIIAAAFVNLVISVTAQRETGALKRRRATPVPVVAIIAGRALTSVVVALTVEHYVAPIWVMLAMPAFCSSERRPRLPEARRPLPSR
jgi:ABC-2 type transport system permease protein